MTAMSPGETASSTTALPLGTASTGEGAALSIRAADAVGAPGSASPEAAAQGPRLEGGESTGAEARIETGAAQRTASIGRILETAQAEVAQGREAQQGRDALRDERLGTDDLPDNRATDRAAEQLIRESDAAAEQRDAEFWARMDAQGAAEAARQAGNVPRPASEKAATQETSDSAEHDRMAAERDAFMVRAQAELKEATKQSIEEYLDTEHGRMVKYLTLREAEFMRRSFNREDTSKVKVKLD
jgi:hypothetical protein